MFVHNIITNIIDVTDNNIQVIYYDFQGHSSNKPFNGLNIIVGKDKISKQIYKF